MDIAGQTAFVTGANRGIGRAFVAELLRRGAEKVYAGVRSPESVDEEMAGDPRVEVIRLDLTDHASIDAAAQRAEETTLLVNNAGATIFGSLLDGSLDDVRSQLEVNALGMLAMTRAMAPALRTHGGAVITLLSAIAWFSAPMNGAYAASKSAAWSLTNGLRAELAADGVTVQAVHFGAVDTDFAAGYDGPKISPLDVAQAALDGAESGMVEVLVDEHAVEAKRSLQLEPNAMVRRLVG